MKPYTGCFFFQNRMPITKQRREFRKRLLKEGYQVAALIAACKITLMHRIDVKVQMRETQTQFICGCCNAEVASMWHDASLH